MYKSVAVILTGVYFSQVKNNPFILDSGTIVNTNLVIQPQHGDVKKGRGALRKKYV
jgi:hypothetical protein